MPGIASLEDDGEMREGLMEQKKGFNPKSGIVMERKKGFNPKSGVFKECKKGLTQDLGF